MVKALVTGCSGQDATYLCELLVSKGYEVHGLIRRTANQAENLKYLPKEVKLFYGDLASDIELTNLLAKNQYDEIYNLAGQSDVRISYDVPVSTGDINALGVTRLLEAIRYFSPHSKLYQASTSELFGNAPPPQNELTPMVPNSPYACAKLYSHAQIGVYRRSYNLFCCAGILYNHESPRRGLNFVTRKITDAVAKITYGMQDRLMLGNLDAKRDWGFARDYVEAMWLILQQSKPDDFVIGSGEAHSVREFVDYVFSLQGMDYRDFVVTDPELYRPCEVNYLQADAAKARTVLGWQPKTTFKELAQIMLEADLKRVKQLVKV